jgi:hypothetical protein
MDNNAKLTFDLSINDVNVVLTALREMPYRAVNDLINNIVAQAESQLKAKELPEQ